jgi:copper homeostasis protein
VTFHRAFDQLTDPLNAIDRLVQLPQIDRILTDGGGGDPVSRCQRLREYAARAAGRVAILAGGGVTGEAFELFVRTGCVREIHVGRIARDGNAWDSPVSTARVRRLRRIAG